MKRISLIASCFFSLCFLANQIQAQAFKYTFTFEGFSEAAANSAEMSDSVAYLVNWFGGKQYYNDTATINNKGQYIFEGEDPKKAGVYGVLLGDKKSYVEFIIAEPEFSMTTSYGGDMMRKAVFTNSQENTAFQKYFNSMGRFQGETKMLQDQMKATEDEKEKAKIQEDIDTKLQVIKAFKKEFYKSHPELFCTKVFMASDDPEIPEVPAGVEDPEQWKYMWFRKHYFDNIDLTDQRMLRTPVFHTKIDYYIQKLTPQVPDTICYETMRLANISGEGTEIYRYIVQHTVNTYEKKKIMGMDAVFVGIAEQVYCQGKAYWLDEERTAEICERYEAMKNLVIGLPAENIILPDTGGYWTNLYEVDANYTVLIFWASDCGHCKKEMPKLLEAYHNMKDMGVKVFAVSTQFENKDWKKFVRENGLDWINVSDNPEINTNAYWYITNNYSTINSLNFREYWDIFSTPQVYILDKEKKIIGKKIGAEQLEDFLTKYDEDLMKEKSTVDPNANGKSDIRYQDALAPEQPTGSSPVQKQ